MAQPVIQTSFNAGEWAPALNARVDLKQYHSAAALLRNFFVDYRGGATTRPGTKYILRTFLTSTARVIPFQASFTVAYLLEFGNNYIRFYFGGAPVLEPATSITVATAGPPEVFTDTAHGYANGDWIFVAGVCYIVQGITTNTFTLTDLFGNAINTNPFTLPANAQRVYTVPTPYAAADLGLIKYAQNVNQLFLTHPNYPPALLTLITAANWTYQTISFGPTIATPTGLGVTSTLAAGTVNYAYTVAAVDPSGQESAPATPAALASKLDLRSNPGTNTITWTAVPGAVSYNVYKAEPSYTGAVPAGAVYGFIGNCTGVAFNDSNIASDFTQTPSIIQNPFLGASIQSYTVTTAGSYTTVPTVTIGAPAAGGTQATASAVLGIVSGTIASGGTAWVAGDIGTIVNLTTGGGSVTVLATIKITGVAAGAVTSFSIQWPGSITTGSTPTNPLVGGTGVAGKTISINATWGVVAVTGINNGSGYTSVPSVTFAPAGAAATAVLGPAGANPSVASIHQQRLVMAAPTVSPSQLNLSQPGALLNFNTSFPIVADDAIQATLSNTTLNSIKSLTSVSAGLLVLSDKGAWVINGGGFGTPISAVSIVANPQTYSGANDLPPLITPNDILYMKSKGSVVVDLAYNFYLSNYVGTDISLLSSHLFYGFNFTQWAWAEEPFKTAWLVRSDGIVVSLGFVKEQELVAWAHHDTQGTFTSVASLIENTSLGFVDATYFVVRRTINGQTVQYIERFVELTYPNDYRSSWQVDAGIGYSGAPATTFTNAQHLAGAAVTGLADGVVINFTMPTTGTFQFGPGGTAGLTGIANASIVTVGLSFTPQIQTLALDLGEPTVQGKRKKVAAATLRVQNALGLSAGRTLSTLLPLKDLVIGNMGTMTNQQVTGLVTGDVRIIMDPQYDVFGQYIIQQSNPYPASVLGLIPEIEVGDTPK